jgi:pyrroloquinoline quinone biosynthesis protein D
MSFSHPKISKKFRFQWEAAQNNYVLLYPEGMVKLNNSAGEILAQCDGLKSVPEIIHALEKKFETSGLEPQVIDFLEHATTQSWICEGGNG